MSSINPHTFDMASTITNRLFRINLHPVDIASIAQNSKLLERLNEIDKEILIAIKTYVGDNSRKFISSLKSELESQLQTVQPIESTPFKFSISDLISLGSRYPVAKAFMSLTAEQIHKSATAYEQIMHLGHSYYQPDLVQYKYSLSEFKTFLKTAELPEKLSLLEDHLTLLTWQLSHKLNEVYIDSSHQRVTIPHPIIPRGSSLTIPSQIHVESIYFSEDIPLHISICKDSSIGFVRANINSTFSFEDHLTRSEFITNNPSYFYRSNLIEP